MSEIRAMLVGASRSGKTSILASMLEGCAENLFNYRLQLRFMNPDTSLRDAIHDMDDLCDTEPEIERMTSLMGTRESKNYEFKLSYLDALNYPTSIVITDVPGEWFDSYEADKMDKLEEIAQNCQIIIVAVDTPAMLWGIDEGQSYQRLINCTDALRPLVERLGGAIDENNENKSLKSIIFAPIKCEKYLHKDEDKFKRDIEIAIKRVYADIINRVEQSRCKVSIIPMETIGGIEFSRYSDDEDMKILYYNPDLETSGYEMGKQYEDATSSTTPDGDATLQKLTRCETMGCKSVRIARTGETYDLQEGDVLKPTKEMTDYPYVYKRNKTIPYIWYRSNGRGFKQRNCEKILYEIVKTTIQQIVSSAGIQDINTFINRRFNRLEIFIMKILGRFGVTNVCQIQELCKSLKKMAQNGEFNEAIEIINNIDKDGLKIRTE